MTLPLLCKEEEEPSRPVMQGRKQLPPTRGCAAHEDMSHAGSGGGGR